MHKSMMLDQLKVLVFPSREELGKYGAVDAAEKIRSVISRKGEANMIFASSPSQMDVLNAMLQRTDIEWEKINAFHMDEYIGVSADMPYSFVNYIKVNLFSKVKLKSVHYLDGLAMDPEKESKRYADLLDEYPTDITMYGIGANGHLAFNDPGIADFNDPVNVKINASLDAECINQQVVDGWFATHEDVPKRAYTVTMPPMLRSKYMIGMVPSITKANIIGRLFREGISEDLPGSALRNHPNAILLLDQASASEIDPEMSERFV